MTRIVDEIVEDALRELADEPWQRELWLATGGPQVSSYIECVARLFDDSGLGDALDRSEGVYSQQIDDRMRTLGRILDQIDGTRPPKEILSDKHLGKARVLARQLLIDLRRFATDDS